MNDLSDFKIEAQIDEHYIDRIKVGLSATFERDGKAYDLLVRKVYPEVRQGNSAQIGSSGNYAQIGSSGDSAQIGSSGGFAQIGSSGNSAQIGSSGDYAKIGSSGNYAQIDSSGQNSVIMCAGPDSKAKAAIGSWITLAEWKRIGDVWKPICVKTEQVDGKRKYRISIKCNR